MLVYAGAVMVMFLFVIAYLGDRAAGPLGGRAVVDLAGGDRGRRGAARRDRRRDRPDGGRRAHRRGRRSQGSFGSPAEIGRLFLTDHLLAFEITSIVLLIAAVGGVVLGTHSRAEDEEESARARA